MKVNLVALGYSSTHGSELSVPRYWRKILLDSGYEVRLHCPSIWRDYVKEEIDVKWYEIPFPLRGIDVNRHHLVYVYVMSAIILRRLKNREEKIYFLSPCADWMLPIFFIFKKKIHLIGPMGVMNRSVVWNKLCLYMIKSINRNTSISIRMSSVYAEIVADHLGLKILPERAMELSSHDVKENVKDKVLVLYDPRKRKNFEGTMLYAQGRFKRSDIIVVGAEVEDFKSYKRMDKSHFDNFLRSKVGTYVTLSSDEGFSSLIEECLRNKIKIVSYRVGILRDPFFDDYLTSYDGGVVQVMEIDRDKLIGWEKQTKKIQLDWLRKSEI